ncbi:MAG: MazG nucleotide pyrophosphohydrolase domain-containing protein, partial [Gammaproteobacteria bacterium]|nr:MazG nucleotide pyrophosphohydrolase domain-containing protein [Gammaproteobacteria bacterium]
EKTQNAAGILSGIAITLPALTRSVKLQKRAAQVGFDWPSIMPIFDKIREELEEVTHEFNQDNAIETNQDRIEDEIGDLLFACTNLARFARINPETALRRSNRKFENRFAHMEKLAAERSLILENLDLDTWDQLWEQVKSEENMR